MKLYAHRGWTKGPGENSLSFFERAAGCGFLDGVEFDIRKGRDGRPVVIHDPLTPADNPPTLDSVIKLLKPSGLELFAEIKEADIASAVIDCLVDHGVTDRAVVFGFPPVVAELPWHEERPAKLGLIAHLPWQARKLALQYRPDVLMTGWDDRRWTKTAVRAVWPLFSLRRTGNRFDVPIAGGIARSAEEYRWLKSRGFDVAVADLDPGGDAKFADGSAVSHKA